MVGGSSRLLGATYMYNNIPQMEQPSSSCPGKAAIMCMHVSTYVCVYMCMCACVHVCMHDSLVSSESYYLAYKSTSPRTRNFAIRGICLKQPVNDFTRDGRQKEKHASYMNTLIWATQDYATPHSILPCVCLVHDSSFKLKAFIE